MKKILSVAFAFIILIVSMSSSKVSAKNNYDFKKTKDDLYQIINKNNLVDNRYSKTDKSYKFIQKDIVAGNTYSVTTVDVVSSGTDFLDIVEENSSIARLGGGSNYKEKYDGAISNMAYTTVYYTESESSGDSYFAITSVSGGYINNDWTCKVISQKLSFGQTSNLTSYATTKTPTGTSWSYTAPSSWKPVKTTKAVNCYVGAIYTLQIQRYSTPWTLELENYIVKSPGTIWP